MQLRVKRESQEGPLERKWSRGALVIACAAIVSLAVISFLPIQDKLLLHTKGRLHFWGHAGAFAVISYLLIGRVRSDPAKVLMFLSVLALGCGIEFGQHVLYHEALEWMDVLVDWIGILFGAMLTMLQR